MSLYTRHPKFCTNSSFQG